MVCRFTERLWSIVIAASKGVEVAGETEEFENGIFTHYVLERLKSKKEGDITVSELKDYVFERVKGKTENWQTPTVRRESLEFDFPVY